MPQLNAFVGHSFAKEDEVVVRELLTLLESIKNVMSTFTWDSAEAAEPKVLSVKVREKMKGKNLFIGICTAREQTVQVVQPPALLARWFLPQTQLAVERTSIETKTADWIIQEIAYALGSNMDLIILLEDGVRPPGGMQGDMEYIPFTRGEPSKCFEKLSSMLRSLSPRPTSSVESQENAAPSESTDAPGDLFLQSYLTPDETWTADTYVSRFRFSILIDKPEFQTKISESFRNGAFYQEEEARVAFEAALISERAQAYKEDWIDPLQKLLAKHPALVGPYLAFGERFSAAGEYERAAQNYELAAQHSTLPHKKIQCLTEAATQRANAKQPEAAEKLLRRAADLLRATSEYEAEGLAQISYVWKELGKTSLFFACAERCLEVAPDRTDPRFALAHQYAQIHRDAEALFHYRQYLLAKDDPGAWNNVGVAASALKLPVTAVESYLRADNQGNTLATSNLAFNKLEAGFVEEATELCERGLKTKEPDTRLLDALADCKRVPRGRSQERIRAIGRDKGPSRSSPRDGESQLARDARQLAAHLGGPTLSVSRKSRWLPHSNDWHI